MKTAIELKGTKITAKVKLHNYRFPKTHIESGNFAIVVLDLIRLIDGIVPNELELKRVPGKYQFIATGYLPKLEEESEYIFQGTLVIDKDWGPQYETESIRLDYDLSREEDQRKFFSYFMSDKQVEMLFNSNSSPITLLETKNLGELQKIKGIGPAISARMCIRYEESKNNSRAYVALKSLDLSKRVIDRLIKSYGSADIVVDKIETNPYILIKEVKGIGWKKADDFALRQGMTRNCKERVLAYSNYYLDQQANINGNSWITIDDLCLNIKAECDPIEQEVFSSWLKEFTCGNEDFPNYYLKYLKEDLNSDDPWFYYDKSTRRIGLLKYRMLEKAIGENLKRLKEGIKEVKINSKIYNNCISESEVDQKFSYTDEQKNAIQTMYTQGVSILTGGAGTGKTSTLYPLIKMFKKNSLSVGQCALSGRASSLLNDVTKVKGKTIHRLLNYLPDEDRFAFTQNHPLPYDVIILDEASMVGGELFLSLISAIKTGARFIMLGDTHQLESIGLANILKDCLSSGYIQTNILTKIHRQAAMSGIITQSLLVSEGKSIVKNNFLGEEIRGDLRDFKLIGCSDTSMVQYNIIQEFKRLFEQKIPIDDIQVIVPMRIRGDTSCRNLNTIIQQIVNPAKSTKDVMITCNENGISYHICYKPGDRIIVTKNNYHAEDINGKEQQIFNGNMGKIKDISEDVMIVTVGDVGDIVLQRDQWDGIQLGYAITVHKKQGDSIPYAIVGIDTSAYALLSRELLYTAITRASRFCTLIVQPQACNVAVRTSRIKLKQTWLKDDLFNYLLQKEGVK